jgi:hypothetical protein
MMTEMGTLPHQPPKNAAMAYPMFMRNFLLV